MAQLRTALPEPSAYVTVDVSGRVPGDREVREITLGLLRAVPEAVATDDFTSHPWRREEVLNGARVQGHPFFDYQGWYDETAG